MQVRKGLLGALRRLPDAEDWATVLKTGISPTSFCRVRRDKI